MISYLLDLDSSASWSSCVWVAWTRNLIAYSDTLTMTAIALTRCIYITSSKVSVVQVPFLVHVKGMKVLAVKDQLEYSLTSS